MSLLIDLNAVITKDIIPIVVRFSESDNISVHAVLDSLLRTSISISIQFEEFMSRKVTVFKCFISGVTHGQTDKQTHTRTDRNNKRIPNIIIFF